MMDINEIRDFLNSEGYIAAEIVPATPGDGGFSDVQFYIATNDIHQTMVITYIRTEENPSLHFSSLHSIIGNFYDHISDLLMASITCNQFKSIKMYEGTRYYSLFKEDK